MNTAMRLLIPKNHEVSANALKKISKCLEPFFDNGLILIDDILTTSWFWSRRGNASLSNCHDQTGLECLVNLLHLDDEFAKEEWIDAIKVVGMFLANRPLVADVRLIATIDDLSCTTRFHLIRQGQRWLTADLNSYESPVLYCDYLRERG